MKYGDPPHTEGEGYQAVAVALDRLRDEIGQRHTENTSSLEVLEQNLKVVIDRVDDLARGFPENDPDGHRRAHEAMIRKDEARTQLYQKILEKLVTDGMWAAIVFVIGCIVFFAASKLHIAMGSK